MEDINNIKNKLNPEQQSVVDKIHWPTTGSGWCWFWEDNRSYV